MQIGCLGDSYLKVYQDKLCLRYSTLDNAQCKTRNTTSLQVILFSYPGVQFEKKVVLGEFQVSAPNLNYSQSLGDVCFTCNEYSLNGSCKEDMKLFKAAITRREAFLEVTTDFERLKFS